MRVGAAALLLFWTLGGGVAAPQSVAQDRRSAEIESTLKRIRLPPGFSISLYALAPRARTLAIGREGKAIFVGAEEKDVYAITPGEKTAAAVERFAPSMPFTMPHGVCFSNDGALFLVERNRVTRFDDAENTWRDAAANAKVVVKSGDLIPRNEESRGHSSRVCRIGPDDKLYISLGQPNNVAPRDRLALYEKNGNRRHHSDESRRIEAVKSSRRAFAIPSAWRSTPMGRSGSPTIRSTPWATIVPLAKSIAPTGQD